jgi:predicted GH43/DUF377 family glycosyl hydrolase
MSVNTLVKDGILTELQSPVKILHVQPEKGEIHYNPGLARDPSGTIYMSVRSCITNFKEKFGITHPLGYENFLHVGIFDEKTQELSGIKEIKPDKEYPGFQWGIEDVRLFWREDGLHGIGVILPVVDGHVKLREGEILIDYEAGTYALIKDHGRPFGHAEKNWMPSEYANEHFDFIYSPTQVVKDGEVIGEDNDLFIHNGTPLIHFEDGYLAIGHSVISVMGERTYAQLALKFDARGKLTHQSQFFHFNVGWREQLKETIEFASGLLWAEGKEGSEAIVGFGVKDELVGICNLNVSELRWEPYADTMYYAWQWEEKPNRVEISNEPTPDPASHHTAPAHQLA